MKKKARLEIKDIVCDIQDKSIKDKIYMDNPEMKMYPKDILIDEMDWRMTKILNEIVGYDYHSSAKVYIRDYTLDEINNYFDALKKRRKYSVLGKCTILFEIINMLNIRVNKRGYQMLKMIINKFDD